MIKIVVCVVVVLTLQLAGCSGADDRELPKKTNKVTPQRSDASDKAKTEDIAVVTAEAQSIQGAQQEALRVDASSVPFRLSALFSGGGYGARAGLVSQSDGVAMVVSVGETFMEYKVEEINYALGEVVVSHNGQLLLISQSGGKGIKERTVAVNRDQGSEIDLLKIKGPMFEPTPEEVNVGIDPNNCETWPKNYRGPEIERLLRKSEGDDYVVGGKDDDEDLEREAKLAQGIDDEPEKRLTEESAFPEASLKKQFKATDKECMRGIDPNNPDTWPEGYMGPGIERVLDSNN